MVPKTLLEWTIELHWGPPASRTADGRAYWVCQFHNDTHPSFCTMPPNPKYKDRAICFGCNFRGDIYDYLRLLYPCERFPELRARVEYYQQEMERANSKSHGHCAGHSGLSFSGDCGDADYVARAIAEADRGYRVPCNGLAYLKLSDAWREEETSEAFGLQILKQAVEICRHCDTTVAALVDRWEQYSEMDLNWDLWDRFPCN